MADEPTSRILEYMRRFERRLSEMDAKLDCIRDDVHGLKVRMTGVEENLVGVHRRLDRMDERLERVERRLGLVEAPL